MCLIKLVNFSMSQRMFLLLIIILLLFVNLYNQILIMQKDKKNIIQIKNKYYLETHTMNIA